MKIPEYMALDIVDGVYYPSSEEEQLPESKVHTFAMVRLFEALCDHLQSRPGYFTTMDIRSCLVWRENNPQPFAIFKIASEETWQYDLEDKPGLHALLGVHEYYLFDPEASFLRPPLRGFHLTKTEMVKMRRAKDGSLLCNELGLQLIPEGQMLRLIDTATGDLILTCQERAEKAEAEVKRLKQQLASLTKRGSGGGASK